MGELKTRVARHGISDCFHGRSPHARRGSSLRGRSRQSCWRHRIIARAGVREWLELRASGSGSVTRAGRDPAAAGSSAWTCSSRLPRDADGRGGNSLRYLFRAGTMNTHGMAREARHGGGAPRGQCGRRVALRTNWSASTISFVPETSNCRCPRNTSAFEGPDVAKKTHDPFRVAVAQLEVALSLYFDQDEASEWDGYYSVITLAGRRRKS